MTDRRQRSYNLSHAICCSNGTDNNIFGVNMFGLEAKILASASASKLWPRPQTFGIVLASISLSYVMGHFSAKNRKKIGNFDNCPTIILNRMLLIIIIWYFFHNYFWPRPVGFGPQPPEIGLSLGLGLDLIALASAS